MKESDKLKKMIIEGNMKLSGTIPINGAKNSAVALLPAAILSDEKTVIKNIPNITDIDVLEEIINLLNGKIIRTNDKLEIDSSKLKNAVIPENLSKKLRASYYFMGALLAKFKHVEIFFPGGCNFGARQIDYHLKGFEKLGVKIITTKDEKIIMDAEKLHGSEIDLPFASVGATINIMLAATKANGKTIINNAAKEPEIVNVADFLNKMGAKIKGAGSECIEIIGVKKLGSSKIDVIPDRIEAGTYIIAGALMGDNLKITNVNMQYLDSLLKILKEMQVDYKITENEILLNQAKKMKPVKIKTAVYPGFPTDLAQPISVLLSKANGVSYIEETIYHHRMGHVEYLKKMGANIEIKNNIEKITGPIEFKGTEVEASDLRAGATLFLAALTSKEETTITNVEYILRGYEKIVKKLSSVGANIRIEEIK